MPTRDLARTRRRLLQAGGAVLAAAGAGCSSRFPTPETGPFAVLFAEPVDDGGFNSSVLEAVTRTEAARGIPMRVGAVPAGDATAAADALRRLARSDAKMIYGVGPHFSAPMQRVAWEYPQRRFTLLQDSVLRPNMAAYVLNEEEPAWLAGFLAARLSAARAVALVSDAPGPRSGRIEAAFRAGSLRGRGETAVAVESAAGGQAAAVARLSGRADIVYGALDSAPHEAVAACRAAGVRFIGCVRDWIPLDPQTVVASALIDPGALFTAASGDIVDAVWRGDLLRTYGLRYPRMLGFAVGRDVPGTLADQVVSAALDVAGGRVGLPPL